MDALVSLFKKIWKGGNAIIATLLCVTLITSVVPAPAIAYAAEATAESIQSNAPPAEVTTTEDADLMIGGEEDAPDIVMPGEDTANVPAEEDETPETVAEVDIDLQADEPTSGDGWAWNEDQTELTISKAAGLVAFAAMVNGTDGFTADSFANKKTILAANIDMEGVAFTPIGTSAKPFAGELDGDSHTIFNLNVSASADNIGLFGVVKGSADAHAKVHDLKLENCSFVTTGQMVGSLVSQASYADVMRCSVSSGHVEGSSTVGGLFGQMRGFLSVAQCAFAGSVKATGTRGTIGGIVGQAHSGDGAETWMSDIIDCYAAPSLDASKSIGSVAGRVTGECLTVANTYAVSEAAAFADGAASIQNCYATAGNSAEGLSIVSESDLKTAADALNAGRADGPWRDDAEEPINGGFPILKWQSDAAEGGSTTTPEEPVIPECGYAWNDDGTELTIYNAAGLVAFTAMVNGTDGFEADSFAGKKVILAKNIDMEGVDFTPIGTKVNPFAGEFDGQSKGITSLNLKKDISSSQYLGLFGYILGSDAENPATVKNVSVMAEIEGNKYLGAIAGYAKYALIEGCDTETSLNSQSTQAYAGGIVGDAQYVTIDKCSSRLVTNIENDNIGYVGGIAGRAMNGSNLIDCFADVDIHGDSGLGGLAGYGMIYGGSMIRCASTGSIVSNTTIAGNGGLVGGLAGKIQTNSKFPELNIQDCYSACVVKGGIDPASLTGKVLLYKNTNVYISNCYAVNAADAGFVSGYSTSSNTGTLTVNGVYGPDDKFNSGAATPIVGLDTVKALNADELKAAAATLNAGREGDEAPWRDDAATPINNGYPVLKWQLESPHDPGTDPVPSGVDISDFSVTFSRLTYTGEDLSSALKDSLTLKSGLKKQNVDCDVTFYAEGSENPTVVVNAGTYRAVIMAEAPNTGTVETTVTVEKAGGIITLDCAENVQVQCGEDAVRIPFTVTGDGGASVTVEPEGMLESAEIQDGAIVLIAPETIAAETAVTVTVSLPETANYTAATQSFTAVVFDPRVAIDITEDGFIIERDGIYHLAEGFSGTVAIKAGVKDVTLIGNGATWSAGGMTSVANQNLHINATAAQGIALTLQDVYINNIQTDANIINFAGEGNRLIIKGTNVIDHNGEALGKAAIHVPPTASLTVEGDGTLYLYKHEQGSGIGGNANEPNGILTFDMQGGQLFGKGSKQGALIGGGSSSAAEKPITFKSGSYNLIGVSRGAVIGGGAGSAGGQGAKDVRIEPGVNMSIYAEYTGSSIGTGGFDNGNDGTGGKGGNLTISGGATLRTFVTANSESTGTGWRGGASPDSITATITDGTNKLALAAIDTSLMDFTATTFKIALDDGDGWTQSGLALPGYSDVNEALLKGYQPLVPCTPANWVQMNDEDQDTNLYIYIPAGVDHVADVNGERFNLTWNGEDFDVTRVRTETAVKTYDLGNGITATLYSNGMLAFAGTGELTFPEGARPWAADADQIKAVSFASTITAPNVSNIFEGCENLVNVQSLPVGIQTMDNAFKDCMSLTRVASLPDTVTSMASAFEDCAALPKAPALPKGIQNMTSAFKGCASLTTLPLIPESATATDEAFSGCIAATIIPDGFAIPESASANNLLYVDEQDGAKLDTLAATYEFETLASLPWASWNRTLVLDQDRIATPVITTQPHGATLALNTEGTISVEAKASDGKSALSYQWYEAASADATPEQMTRIPGATSDTYIFYTGNEKITRYVACQVTVGNQTVTSSIATFNITEVLSIGTPEELVAFSDAVNAGDDYSGKFVVLEGDIDMAGVEFDPIGNCRWKKPFSGTFDGQGHAIWNVNVDEMSSTGARNYEAGLFGYVVGTEAAHASVSNVTVTGSFCGVKYSGAITAWATYADITGCHAQAELLLTGGQIANYAGGLIGRMISCSLSDSSFAGNVINGNNAGGIAGVVDAMEIESTEVAAGQSSTITDCSAEFGTVTGSNYVGGLFGSIGHEVVIERCYATGAAVGTNADKAFGFVGGLAGQSVPVMDQSGGVDYNPTIKDCYFDGTVSAASGNTGSFIGDARGWATPYTSVINCYSSAQADSLVYKTRKKHGFNGGLLLKNTYGFAPKVCSDIPTGTSSVLESGSNPVCMASAAELADPAVLVALNDSRDNAPWMVPQGVAGAYPVLAWQSMASEDPAPARGTLTIDANGGTLAQGWNTQISYEPGMMLPQVSLEGYEVASWTCEPAGSIVRKDVWWAVADTASGDITAKPEWREYVAPGSVSIDTTVTGEGIIDIDAITTDGMLTANPGDELTVTATPEDGSYLAQVRWAVVDEPEADGSETTKGDDADVSDQSVMDALTALAEAAGADVTDEAATSVAYAAVKPSEDGTFTIAVPEDIPEGKVVSVIADFIPIAWDGTLDLTWYDPEASSFTLSYAAQYEGLAAIVNGLFTTYPLDESGKPDVAAFDAAMGITEDVPVGSLYGEISSTYQVCDSQNGFGRVSVDTVTRIVGNGSFIAADSKTKESTGNNQTSSDTFWFGADSFAGKTVLIGADLDFGGVQAGGTWSAQSPLFMSLGGQYTMVPNNAATIIGSSWNGVLDGCGHSFRNVYGERYADTAYGDASTFGLVGRIGVHDEDARVEATPVVRQIVLESGLISSRRSVGGIVGKIGQTTTPAVIEYCINKATITGTDKKGVGGIVGASWNRGIIRYCANFGSVSCTANEGNGFLAGGIVGSNEVHVISCYNVGQVKAGEARNAMAIGTNNGSIYEVDNCWFLESSAAGGGYFVKSSEDPAQLNGSKPFAAGSLTAATMNGGGAVIWMTGSANGGYPVLYFQGGTSVDMGTQYTVTLDQPAGHGTLTSTPEAGTYGTMVTLGFTAEPGWGVSTYYVNGTALEGNAFPLTGDAVVTADVHQLARTKASIGTMTDDAHLVITKCGIAEKDGVLVNVEDEVVEPGSALYEGDVLTIGIEITGELNDPAYDETYAYNGMFVAMIDGKVMTGSITYSITYTVPATVGDELALTLDSLYVSSRTWASQADTSWYDADDVKARYEITTPQQLAGMAYLSSNGVTFEGIEFVLANDISLAGCSWTFGIGYASAPFKGTFDGCGHTIAGLTSLAQNTALFGSVKDATIKDVTVEGNISAPGAAAGIALSAVDSTLENCVNKVTINAVGAEVAGVVGSTTNCAVRNCSNEAFVGNGSASATSCTAGVVGHATNTAIEGCSNSGVVSGAGYVGGIVALFTTGTNADDAAKAAISGCVNEGNVYAFIDGETNTRAGGIAAVVARPAGLELFDCVNKGMVSSHSGKHAYAGGLVGDAQVDVKVAGGQNAGYVSALSADGTAKVLTADVIASSKGESAVTVTLDKVVVSEGSELPKVAGAKLVEVTGGEEPVDPVDPGDKQDQTDPTDPGDKKDPVTPTTPSTPGQTTNNVTNNYYYGTGGGTGAAGGATVRTSGSAATYSTGAGATVDGEGDETPMPSIINNDERSNARTSGDSESISDDSTPLAGDVDVTGESIPWTPVIVLLAMALGLGGGFFFAKRRRSEEEQEQNLAA